MIEYAGNIVEEIECGLDNLKPAQSVEFWEDLVEIWKDLQERYNEDVTN